MFNIRRPETEIFRDRRKPVRSFEQELVRLTAMGLMAGNTPMPVMVGRRHGRGN